MRGIFGLTATENTLRSQKKPVKSAEIRKICEILSKRLTNAVNCVIIVRLKEEATLLAVPISFAYGNDNF